MYVLHFIPFSSCYNFQSGDIFDSWFGLATAAANFDSLLRSLVIVKRHLECVQNLRALSEVSKIGVKKSNRMKNEQVMKL